MSVDYKKLRATVVKSCKTVKGEGLKFTVKAKSLQEALSAMEPKLRLINVGLTSNPVMDKDIVYLSEYFIKDDLKWFDQDKEFTSIIMIPEEAITEDCEELIAKLNTEQIDDPEIDRTEVMAKLIADFPCYFVTIVSYKKHDPRRSSAFELKCRANKVVIKSDSYNYNHEDMA